MYCGNNKLFKGLVDGTHEVGSNYNCLRRGIGVGLNKPIGDTFTSEYEPIDSRKYYCGKKDNLPDDSYDSHGSPSKCLRIGVGIGTKKKYTMIRDIEGIIDNLSMDDLYDLNDIIDNL